MSSSAEAWLMLLAAGLYLYDSLLLLQHDELVVIKSTHKHWRAGFGANGWKIARKEPLLLNPLAPWQSAARIAWNPEGGLQAPGAVSLRLPDVGVLPRVGVTALWVLMFAVLPACLFAVRHSGLTLAVIAAMYSCIVLVLATIRRDWISQGLGARQYWSAAVECIACPPFCINAVRRLSLLLPAQHALSDVAKHENAEGRLNEFKRQLRIRVQEQIDAQAEGSVQLPALLAAAKSLEAVDEA